MFRRARVRMLISVHDSPGSSAFHRERATSLGSPRLVPGAVRYHVSLGPGGDIPAPLHAWAPRSAYSGQATPFGPTMAALPVSALWP